MAVDVGSAAPDFVLTNHNREPVRLSDEFAEDARNEPDYTKLREALTRL